MFCHKVFPKISCDDFISRAEKLGTQDLILNHLHLRAFGVEREKKVSFRGGDFDEEDVYETNELESKQQNQSKRRKRSEEQPEPIRESSPDIYEDEAPDQVKTIQNKTRNKKVEKIQKVKKKDFQRIFFLIYNFFLK